MINLKLIANHAVDQARTILEFASRNAMWYWPNNCLVWWGFWNFSGTSFTASIVHKREAFLSFCLRSCRLLTSMHRVSCLNFSSATERPPGSRHTLSLATTATKRDLIAKKPSIFWSTPDRRRERTFSLTSFSVFAKTYRRSWLQKYPKAIARNWVAGPGSSQPGPTQTRTRTQTCPFSPKNTLIGRERSQCWSILTICAAEFGLCLHLLAAIRVPYWKKWPANDNSPRLKRTYTHAHFCSYNTKST